MGDVSSSLLKGFSAAVLTQAVKGHVFVFIELKMLPDFPFGSL